MPESLDTILNNFEIIQNALKLKLLIPIFFSVTIICHQKLYLTVFNKTLEGGYFTDIER